MNLRGILVVSMSLFGLASFAEAKYDRALDGKTKVWHNTPQRRVQASWSGDRDEKGYATGKGTLTWFRVQRSWETGSLLPKTKYVQVSQYKGKMVLLDFCRHGATDAKSRFPGTWNSRISTRTEDCRSLSRHG